MKWYSVKLLYRFVITGEPDNVDEYYSDDKEIFEETIMLVRAGSFDEAYEKAEKTALTHTDSYTNKYDQQVTYKFAESLDCYCIGSETADCTEIYSAIKGVPRGTTTDMYIDKKLKINDIVKVIIEQKTWKYTI